MSTLSYHLEEARRGRTLTSYYLVLPANKCPSRDYLIELEQANKISHRGMIRRIQSHVDNGTTTIFKHGHPIKGRTNLFVWKTDQGARMLYFEVANRHCVMVIGYAKGDPEERQYDRAENLRDAYFAERRTRR